MSSHSDLYRAFNAHRGVALDSADINEFVSRTGLAWLASYAGGWAERSLATFKAHPDTYLDKSLYLPKARTFAELFEAARILDTSFMNQQFADVGMRLLAQRIGPDFMYLSQRGGRFSGYMGGKRTLRHFPDGSLVRGRFGGAAFVHTYVRPTEAVKAAWRAEMGPDSWNGDRDDSFGSLNGFEVIRRADGILVIAKDASGICARWLALLPLSEADAIMGLLPSEDRAAVEAEITAEAEFEARIEKVDGKPQLRDARAEFVKGTFGARDGWQAEFRMPDGVWYAVLNGNGRSFIGRDKGEALSAAAVALGYQLHK